MNNTTDTNQASEELRKSVEQCFIKNNMCDCDGEHNALNIDETEYFDVESVVNDVISLIRTEKLTELENSLDTHGETCGAVRNGDPRDWCNLQEIVKARIVELKAERAKLKEER